MRRLVPLSLTLTAEVAAVVALHRWWSAPGDLVGRVLWLVAVVGAWWLLASTVLCVAAQFSRRAAARRVSVRLALPAIRRVTERALAASVVAGSLLLAPSAASAQVDPTPEPTVDVNAGSEPPAPTPNLPTDSHDHPAPVPVRTGRAGDPSARTAVSTEQPEPGTDTAPSAPAPTPIPAPATQPEAPSPAPAAPPASDGNAPLPTSHPSVSAPAPSPPAGAAPPPVHTVARGDNLWDIAAAHLAAATGREVATLGEHEIAAYWRRVCDANRARLRSGDANLIFAGETIELPAI